MAYWLVKSEPEVYAYADLVRDKKTCWDHVRNYTARLHLRAMKKGDQALYYHSQTDKAVVGVCKIVREAYPDPTAEDGEDWSAVDVAPVKAFAKPVTLAQIKADPKLAALPLIKQSRLSVMPVGDAEFARILSLGG